MDLIKEITRIQEENESLKKRLEESANVRKELKADLTRERNTEKNASLTKAQQRKLRTMFDKVDGIRDMLINDGLWTIEENKGKAEVLPTLGEKNELPKGEPVQTEVAEIGEEHIEDSIEDLDALEPPEKVEPNEGAAPLENEPNVELQKCIAKRDEYVKNFNRTYVTLNTDNATDKMDYRDRLEILHAQYYQHKENQRKYTAEENITIANRCKIQAQNTRVLIEEVEIGNVLDDPKFEGSIMAFKALKERIASNEYFIQQLDEHRVDQFARVMHELYRDRETYWQMLSKFHTPLYSASEQLAMLKMKDTLTDDDKKEIKRLEGEIMNAPTMM